MACNRDQPCCACLADELQLDRCSPTRPPGQLCRQSWHSGALTRLFGLAWMQLQGQANLQLCQPALLRHGKTLRSSREGCSPQICCCTSQL